MDAEAGAGWVVGIDLGTSNTVAVLRTPDGQRRRVLFDGAPVVPSAVFVEPDGRIVVGRDAERLAGLDPGRFEPNPKRRIDEGSVLLGDREVATVELLAAVLRAVAEAVRETTPRLPPAVLTFPVAWGRHRRRVLHDAALLAGWPAASLVPEPVAAARYFIGVLRHELPPGQAVAVFDFGGGTLDIAVVHQVDGAFAVLGSGGLPELGGLDLDAALVGHVGRLVADAAPALWARLERPASAQDRRDRRRLWDDVRGAKEMLSRGAQAPVPIPGLEAAAHLTRQELERAVAPMLERAADETAAVLARCRLAPGRLAGVLLVGGSSRVPLVAQLLHRRLGVAPTVLEQPELPVAEGAAVHPGELGHGDRYGTDVTGSAARFPTGDVHVVDGPTLAGDPPNPGSAPVGAVPAAVTAAAGAPAPAVRRRGRSRALIGAGTVLAVLLTAGGAWALAGNARKEPSGRGALGTAAPTGGGPTGGPTVGAPLGQRSKWTRQPPLPAKLEAAAVAGYRGELWVAGGLSAVGDRPKLRNTWAYNPTTRRWRAGPDLPEPTSHAAMVSSPDAGLFVLGGWVSDGGSRRVLRYNDQTRRWDEQTPLPQGRVAGAAVWDGARLVFAGGTGEGGAASDEVWGLEQGRWQLLGRLGTPRQKLAAVSDGVGQAWFLAGRDQAREKTLGAVDELAQRVVRGGGSPVDPPREGPAAVRLEGVGVCLLGGQHRDDYFQWWCQDGPAAARLPELPVPRAGIGVGVLGETVYAVGGYNHTRKSSGTDEVYAFTLDG